MFQGYADGFTPSWSNRGNVADVEVSASGVLRRLIQGSSPLVSSLRRGLTDQPDTVAYWPCEDGKNSDSIAPVVGASPMTVVGSPKFEANTDADASKPLPELNGAILSGTVGAYPTSTRARVRVLCSIPAAPDVGFAGELFSVFTGGSIQRWTVFYNDNTGTCQVVSYNRFDQIVDVSSIYAFGGQGTVRFFSLELFQNGANVEFTISSIQPFTNLGGATETINGETFGSVTRVVVNPLGEFTSLAAGHVIVQSGSGYNAQAELDALNGESITNPGGRLDRLCSENGVNLTIDGLSDGTVSDTDFAGPQRIASLVELLREAEFAGQGVLYDGISAGLNYTTKRRRENQEPALTIDASIGQLAFGFQPTDDDQRTRNKAEVTRRGGSSAVYEDVDGPLGTAAIGIYDTSETVNTELDTSVPLYAGWLVSLGTVEGYRFPEVTVDLLASPELIADWLSVRPGSRIDIVNVDTVLPGFPVGDVSLMVEGVSQQFSASTWTGTVRCSPYSPYRIAALAADVGDTSEYACRLESDGAVLAADASAGATSLSVATASGPLWTTTPDDFPVDLMVGGVPVVALACSGASSPQTFTISPLSVARSAGAAVELRQQTRLGL